MLRICRPSMIDHTYSSLTRRSERRSSLDVRLELATAVNARIKGLTKPPENLGQTLILGAGDHFLVDILGPTEGAILGDPGLLNCQKCQPTAS